MEEKIVTIEKIVFGGKGLTRDTGKVALVPFTLPGEKVKIRITKEHRDYLEAEVLEVLQPSPDRVTPACRYFGRCGGCHISHAPYETQLQWKVAILRETLTRAKVQASEIQVVAGDSYHYRHRARFKFQATTGELGFFERESNRIVDTHDCLCLTPGLSNLYSVLRNNLHGLSIPGLSEIDCYENDRGETVAYLNGPLPAALHATLNKQATVKSIGEIEQSQLTIKFRNYELPMRPDIFLQINPKLWKSMIQEVEGPYSDRAESVGVELYCGAGFFTIPLSEHFKTLHACEENAAAIAFVKRHSTNKNVRWTSGRAEDFRFPADATALIVDPPRSGLSKTLAERITRHPFHRMTYVSCDCSSLARDLKILTGSLKLRSLVLFDLFPQTFHFETIAYLG
jgi:23S rRNA (uracil1939-C5)-methyltransferase